MRYLLLATLIFSFNAVAQERTTGAQEAASRLDESDKAILLKTKKLAEPVTNGARHEQIHPDVLEKRVVISPVSPPGNQGRGGFLCPDGTDAACLDIGEKVCPGTTRCVDDQATCFDEYPCDLSEGIVCASEYDDMLEEFRRVVNQQNQLAQENVALRERRLEQKNCVINAATLSDAIRCVRQPPGTE